MRLSRRQFLSSSLVVAAALAQAVPARCRKSEPLAALPEIAAGGPIRPPGALSEKEFRSRCVSCGACVNICRRKGFDAISVESFAQNRSWTSFGKPQVAQMRDFPCTLCMECPPSCPTGALRKIAKEKVAMGMALIDTRVCFGWNGDVCLSCSKACPLGASVFDFYYGQWGNQPYINEKCVGCGMCVRYCPLGGSAVKVVTRERYLEVKEGYLQDLSRTLDMPIEERYRMVYEDNLPRILARGRLVEREFR